MNTATARASRHLILMPGFNGTAALFKPLLQALPSHYRTTVVKYRDEQQLDDYVALVAAQLPDDDAILIAESFSGPVALALMARFPTRIRCAVLSATFLVSPFRALARLAQFIPTAAFGVRIGQRAMLQRFCLDASCDPALMDLALSAINNMPAAAVAARLKVLSRLRVHELCPAIRTPTLILRATRDRLVSPARSRQLIEALPMAIVSDVDGPHLLLQSRPRECAQLISDFVKPELAASPAGATGSSSP